MLVCLLTGTRDQSKRFKFPYPLSEFEAWTNNSDAEYFFKEIVDLQGKSKGEICILKPGVDFSVVIDEWADKFTNNVIKIGRAHV